MNVRSFPRTGTPQAGDHAVDIDYLLTLTNSRLVRMTGNPDIFEMRSGLRHLKSLGLKALVYGGLIEANAAPCANDEGVSPA